MIKHNYKQNSPEWLQFRLNGVGGSDIASVAEIQGAFRNKNAVLREKVTGKVPELTVFEKNLFAQGHEWEEVVRENLNVQGLNVQPLVVSCEDNPQFFCSLDGINEETKLMVEIKYCSSHVKYASYVLQVPPHYNAQVQWQLMCTGYDTCQMIFVSPEGKTTTVMVHRDQVLIDLLRERATKFLSEVAAAKVSGLPETINLPMSKEVDRMVFLKRCMKEQQIALDMMEEEVKQIAQGLLVAYEAMKLENNDVVIEEIVRRGSVDYSKIPELKDIDLNKFRKSDTRYLSIKLKGTTNE